MSDSSSGGVTLKDDGSDVEESIATNVPGNKRRAENQLSTGAKKKAKKLTKDDIAGPNRVATNHTTFNYGLDNKGVDTAKDADSPDLIKSQMYGYNYHSSAPGAQVGAGPYDQQSTSNSGNGGSVNSQVIN